MSVLSVTAARPPAGRRPRPVRRHPRPRTLRRRRLRAAVTALFVLDGAVFGSWAARVPDVAAGWAPGTARSASPCSACPSAPSSACASPARWCARFGAGR